MVYTWFMLEILKSATLRSGSTGSAIGRPEHGSMRASEMAKTWKE
jgi:hypothetical protein